MLEITLESKSIHKSEKGLEHDNTCDNGDKAEKDDFKDTSGVCVANGKSSDANGKSFCSPKVKNLIKPTNMTVKPTRKLPSNRKMAKRNLFNHLKSDESFPGNTY